VLDITFQR